MRTAECFEGGPCWRRSAGERDFGSSVWATSGRGTVPDFGDGTGPAASGVGAAGDGCGNSGTGFVGFRDHQRNRRKMYCQAGGGSFGFGLQLRVECRSRHHDASGEGLLCGGYRRKSGLGDIGGISCSEMCGPTLDYRSYSVDSRHVIGGVEIVGRMEVRLGAIDGTACSETLRPYS